ncbi:MAG: 23S rRNA (uracil(1939)-C(5))-methyltransferase RlmD [Lachnospiraceae bacterium]
MREADIDKKDKKDEKRKKPVLKGCKFCEQCGGCRGQEESYEVHLERKQKQIEAAIGDICKVEPMIGMEEPYYYRKKIYSIFGHERQGMAIRGVRDKTTNKVISIDHCYLDDQKAAAIITSIRDLLRSFKIKTYDEHSEYGLLRYVLVRNAVSTGEIMVVLVLSSAIMPSKNNFVKALRKIHPEIDTVIVSENYKKNKVILGEKESVIFGKGFIKDQLCGKEFRVSSKSLFPTNTIQAEKLYETVISFADVKGNEIVLDAFCGIGSIGILMSDHVKKVISVDSNPNAIRDAVSNIKRNKIKNVDCYTKDAAELMVQIADSDKQGVDVVCMDPPKSGGEERFLDALIKLSPEKIVYVSHNVIVLAEELKYLSRRGYQVKKAVGIDSAPWTVHCDVVVLLERKQQRS